MGQNDDDDYYNHHHHHHHPKTLYKRSRTFIIRQCFLIEELSQQACSMLTFNSLKEVILMQCQHCNYEWQPRKASPIFCPLCKRPLSPVSSRRRLEEPKAIKQTPQRLVRCSLCEKLAMYLVPLPDNAKNAFCLEHYLDHVRSQRQVTEQEVLEVRS